MSNIWYISPSNQHANMGVGDYGSEKEQMNLLTDDILPYLDRAGVRYHRGHPDITIEQRVKESNEMEACFHLSLHSNAGGKGMARGPVAYYYSETGRKFSEKMIAALLELGQENNRWKNSKQETGFYELKRTAAPACLLEVDFHDSVSGVEFLTKRRTDIAKAIAKVIIEWDGKEYTDLTPKDPVDLCKEWGLFENVQDKAYWSDPMTRRQVATLVVKFKELLEKEVKS